MSESARLLGRRPPTDDRHLQRFSLTPSTIPAKPTPVVLGIWWYSAFDFPEKVDGAYWIGRNLDWGSIRGGHAICIKPDALTDTSGWWSFYDQGDEGACVGFAASRMMSLLNRKRYDASWLYHRAQDAYDEWEGSDYDGTSLRAGMDVLRLEGHRKRWWRFNLPPDREQGILENRWAGSVVEILACLQNVQADFVTLCNSWGKDYPHHVKLPLAALERLLREDGEATVVVDRP